MAIQNRRIIIINDAPEVTSTIRGSCERISAKIIEYQCTAYALRQLCEKKWDLLIVCTTNNIQKTIEVCETVRSAQRWSQIIIVSTMVDDAVIAECLSHGADDYVTTPFSIVEFNARVTAAIRRSVELQPILNKINKSAIIYSNCKSVAQNVNIYPTSGQAVIDGITMSLTQTEVLLLAYLVDNVDRFCSKHELLEKVLGYKDECYLPSLYSHMSRLRTKFKKNNLTSIRVETAWRSGYKLTTTEYNLPIENVTNTRTEIQSLK